MLKKYFRIFILLLSISSINLCFANTPSIIYVYNDAGVSKESLLQTHQMLQAVIGKQYAVRNINAEAIKKDAWTQKAALLVIPGGADVPYTEKLNGEGNRIIKEYVKNGGAFLGICAGGYYGASFVEFDQGGPLEVVGARELQFFPGKAVGPVLAQYDYQSNSGARAANILLRDGSSLKVYYNGGAFFPRADTYANVNVWAWYQLSQHQKLPAILAIKYGHGRVILSGVHFDYAAERLNKQDTFIAKIIPVLAADSAKQQVLAQNILQWLLPLPVKTTS